MAPALSPVRVFLGKKLNVGAARTVLLLLSCLESLRVRDTESAERHRDRSLVLGNISAAIGVVAIVDLLSRFIGAVPAWSIAAFCTAVVVVLVWSSLPRRTQPAARILLGWATVPLAFAIGGWAELLSLTDFVPTLLLVWLSGVLLFGLWTESSGLVSVSVAAAMVWATTAFVYDYSLLPGFAVLAVGVGYLGHARRGVPLMVVCSATFVTLTELACYDILHRTRYPLVFDPAHLPLALTAWCLTLTAWAVLADTERHRWLRRPVGVTNAVLIFLIYLTFTAPQAWRLVDTSFDNPATLPLGLGGFAIAVALLLWRRGSALLWLRLWLWLAAFVAVWLSNHGLSTRLLGMTAGVVAIGMSLARLLGRRSSVTVLGALMLSAAGVVSAVCWQLPFGAVLVELALLALIVGRAARHRQPEDPPADAVSQSVTGPTELSEV